ncbi:MAG: hypothetical protein PHQ89_03075 [Bacilli bacterium]|nr:hypothetical protein [Bacilli bacterium]
MLEVSEKNNEPTFDIATVDEMIKLLEELKPRPGELKPNEIILETARRDSLIKKLNALKEQMIITNSHGLNNSSNKEETEVKNK